MQGHCCSLVSARGHCLPLPCCLGQCQDQSCNASERLALRPTGLCRMVPVVAPGSVPDCSSLLSATLLRPVCCRRAAQPDPGRELGGDLGGDLGGCPWGARGAGGRGGRPGSLFPVEDLQYFWDVQLFCNMLSSRKATGFSISRQVGLLDRCMAPCKCTSHVQCCKGVIYYGCLHGVMLHTAAGHSDKPTQLEYARCRILSAQYSPHA